MADPTVADVFNQLVLVNGKLDNIDTNTFGQAAALNTLDADVNKGFKATVDALTAIAQINVATVELLFHLTEQADTMICALEHISENTCKILTEVTIQTGLQTDIRDDADTIRDILEFAHPEGALGRKRLAELQEQIERCCPPETPRPACTYQPCHKPKRVELPDLPKVKEHVDVTVTHEVTDLVASGKSG